MLNARARRVPRDGRRAFAFELPDVSAGWIEAFDVETRPIAGDVARASCGSWPSASRAWQDEVARKAHDAGLDVLRIGVDRNEDRHRAGGVRHRAAAEQDQQAIRDGVIADQTAMGSALALVRAARHAQSCRARSDAGLRRRLALGPRPALAPALASRARRRRRGRADRTAGGRPTGAPCASASVRADADLRASLETARGQGRRRSSPGSSRRRSQLAPFEVVGGSASGDILNAPAAFFQYHYRCECSARSLRQGRRHPGAGSAAIASEPVAGGAALQGRDRAISLPALPMRVLSLVPAGAPTFATRRADTFGDIDARRFRSNRALVASAVAFGSRQRLVRAGRSPSWPCARHRTPADARPLLSAPRCCAAPARARTRCRPERRREGWSRDSPGARWRRCALPARWRWRRPPQTLVEPGAPPSTAADRHRSAAAPKRAMLSATIAAERSRRPRQTAARSTATRPAGRRRRCSTTRRSLRVLRPRAYTADNVPRRTSTRPSPNATRQRRRLRITRLADVEQSARGSTDWSPTGHAAPR